jgi:biopolymer transport protein ExbD
MTSTSTSSDRQAYAPLAEINVTPLVDVMLVLFVIFLVMAPLLTHAIRIDLPRVTASSPAPRDHTVTVSVDAHDGIDVDGHATTLESLETLLAQRAARDAGLRVTLRSDQKEPFGNVARVLATIGHSGIRHVAIVTADANDAARAQTTDRVKR